MAGKRDYYEVLGLGRGASAEDVKKAYKTLARRYHPDVNPGDRRAEERFKEINEANEVLSDPEKRARYDRWGFAGVDPGFDPAAAEAAEAAARRRTEGGFRSAAPRGFGDLGDLGDLFGSIFGAGFGARSDPNAPRRGEDLRAELTIRFEEAAFGCEKSVRLERVEPCAACGGTGETDRRPCSVCGGRGKVRRRRTVPLRIPAGADEGETLTLRGRGGAGRNGGDAGDLLVELHVRPDARFRRDGANILLDRTVSFAQAALGAEIEVPTLDGRVKYAIPPGTQSGTTFRLRGKGVPGRNRIRGDQLVTVHVEVPRSMTGEQAEALRRFDALLRGSDHTKTARRAG